MSMLIPHQYVRTTTSYNLIGTYSNENGADRHGDEVFRRFTERGGARGRRGGGRGGAREGVHAQAAA